jgi:hypothetical protein
VSELLSCNREWRARNSTGQKVDPAKIGAIDFVDGSFNYLPTWAILAEGVTSMMVNLDGRGEVKAGRFESCSLSSSSRANLQNR